MAKKLKYIHLCDWQNDKLPIGPTALPKKGLSILLVYHSEVEWFNKASKNTGVTTGKEITFWQRVLLQRKKYQQ